MKPISRLRSGSGLALVAVVLAASCAPAKLDATFTSRRTQHDTCDVIGTRPQVCARTEDTDDVRVHLVELDDDNVWLYGIPRNGVADRAILGTRDTDGGFLFVDESSQANAISQCTLDNRLEIALVIDDKADASSVGTNPCIALLGRENEITTSTPGCDQVNNPPAAKVETANRRWEKPPACAQ